VQQLPEEVLDAISRRRIHVHQGPRLEAVRGEPAEASGRAIIGGKRSELSVPKREEILTILADRRELLEEHGVSSISLFGSFARGEATDNSDVDLLVEFSRPIGLFEFVALKRALERVLGRSVDLATRASLRPQLRERILKEAVRAA
jgi:hypothetical protein